jgi:hypothetical protein
MAADEERQGAWFYERMFDRVGTSALQEEISRIKAAWPSTDILVLRPSPNVLSAMRPNPMEPKAAVPSFVRTLTAMKRTLARPEVWGVLDKHLSHAPSARPVR